MKIKCFGIAKDIIGTHLLDTDAGSISNVSDLRQWLIATYPEFAKIKSCMIAINQEYAMDSDLINGTDEIAIIPPVAGG